MTKMIENHINTCPECGSSEVYYERFSYELMKGQHPEGSYACCDCGWVIDARKVKYKFHSEGKENA